jgi:hypothetical protein
VIWGSNLVWGKGCLSAVKHSNLLWGPPTLLFNGSWSSFQGIKWPEHETDHSLPSTAEVKDEWRCVSPPPVCLHGMDNNNLLLYSGPFLVMSI